MNTVVIVHGWGNNSSSNWIPWLRNELEQRGVEVVAPDMPGTDTPTIDVWVPYLSNLITNANEELYLVGHSVGCQTILRYLTSLPKGVRVGGVAFVAGWTILKDLETDEENNIARQWEETPIDWDDAIKRTSSYVDIYSEDDPYVPVENAEFLQQKLRAKLVLDAHGGHFSDSDGTTELPILLNELLIIMGLPVQTMPIS